MIILTPVISTGIPKHSSKSLPETAHQEKPPAHCIFRLSLLISIPGFLFQRHLLPGVKCKFNRALTFGCGG